VDPVDQPWIAVAALSPEYGDALSDHTPMVAESLERLGRPDRIAAYLEKTLPKRRALVDETDPELADFGRLRAEAEKDLEQLAVRGALERWVDRWGDGLSGAAFHGALRVAHALRALERRDSAPRRRELAGALAYATLRRAPLQTESPASNESPAKPTTLLETLSVLEPDPDALVGRSGLISTAVAARAARHPTLASRARSLALPDDDAQSARELVHAAAELFLSGEMLSGSVFTLLHAVTGMAAVARISRELPLPKRDALLRQGAHALLAMRVAFVGRFPFASAPAAPRSFDEGVKRAIETLDDHAVKLAVTLRDADAGLDERARADALDRWLSRLAGP